MRTSPCGFIMPISAIGDYSVEHWEYVKNLLSEIVKDIGFGSAEIVSYDEINPDIKSRIINHIFSIPIIICDVSGNNPNVLYELGLRVGFDMPIIIIKDSKTTFNFDISSFEHVIYPDNIELQESNNKDLQAFKVKLRMKLVAISQAFENNSSVISPLRNYLDPDSYLTIKRGVPFNIEGTYEYICYRDKIGYSHGGLCEIRRLNSFGNLIEWQLKGQRCWIKLDRDHAVEKFPNPFRWETKKAVIFPDKSFILNYNIQTDESNILGVIHGEVNLEANSNKVDFFIGDYNQDEGKRITKGKFRMIKIAQGINFQHHCFNLQTVP